MAREQREHNNEHPSREPDDRAECQDGTMLVWHEMNMTISEVSGAPQNMGAFWCDGKVSAAVLAAEYDTEYDTECDAESDRMFGDDDE